MKTKAQIQLEKRVEQARQKIRQARIAWSRLDAKLWRVQRKARLAKEQAQKRARCKREKLAQLARCRWVRERKAQLRKPITPTELRRNRKWLKEHYRPIVDGKTILFKAVSPELRTQEGTRNVTTYHIGKMITVPKWNPRDQECGAGKFHACDTPMHANGYRQHNFGNRFIAISIAVKDLYAWPEATRRHPTKIAFRKGKVLFECDHTGRRK